MTLKQAFSANLATFYDARTGKPQSVILRYIFIAVAAALAIVCRLKLSDAALSALITVFGVLLGFGYSVQFYIAGTSIPTDNVEDAIENAGDKRVLRKLSDEVYDNVAYLNYVIFLAILPPFSLLIPTPRFLVNELPWLEVIMNGAGLFALWYLSIEAASTFYRVLKRSSLYFGERKRLRS